MTPKPEAQVARFLVGMFRNRFLEAGVDAKVSPKVSLAERKSSGGPQNLSVTLSFLSGPFLALAIASARPDPQPDQHRAPKVNQSDQTSTAPLHKVAPAHRSIP